MITLTLNNAALKRAVLELPNPVFSNTVALDSSANIKRSMDGVLYSYVKSNEERFQILMDFERIGYGRAQATSDYFRAFAGNTFDLTDHDGIIWHVRFDQPEFNFVVNRRAGPENGSRAEHCSFSLQFIGKKV